MSNELTMFKGGAVTAPSKVFEQSKVNADALDAGIGIGFASVRYKGAKWGIKFQGETTMLRRWDAATGRDDGPAPFLDCVLVDAAEHPAKYFYKGTYTEGDNAPPDCWSSNGVVPDAGSPDKQSTTCAGCRWNAWGSKITNDGTVSRGKECSDHKRLIVVPVGDILNRAYGGPMLLQIPPTSLKKLGPYKTMLGRAGFAFNQVWTRISFNEESAFPLMEFDAVRQLSDDEARQVLEVENDPLCDRILNSEIIAVEGYDNPLPTTIPAATAATPAPAPVRPPQPVTAPTPVTPPVTQTQAVAQPALTPAEQEIIRLKAQLAAAQAAVPVQPEAAKPVQRRRRTATPSPVNASSEPSPASQVQAETQQQLPLPLGPKVTEVVTAPGNGHDLNPEAVQDISRLIEKLV